MIFDNLQILLNLNRKRTISLLYYFFCLDLRVYHKEWQLIQTIPGIDQISAAMLLAEIGTDMNQFGSKEKLSSWVGICPGNNESAGKKKNSRICKGN